MTFVRAFVVLNILINIYFCIECTLENQQSRENVFEFIRTDIEIRIESILMYIEKNKIQIYNKLDELKQSFKMEINKLNPLKDELAKQNSTYFNNAENEIALGKRETFKSVLKSYRMYNQIKSKKNKIAKAIDFFKIDKRYKHEILILEKLYFFFANLAFFKCTIHGLFSFFFVFSTVNSNYMLRIKYCPLIQTMDPLCWMHSTCSLSNNFTNLHKFALNKILKAK